MSGDFVECSKDLIESTESTLSPDNEATEVTTRSELEEVEPPYIDELNTRNIAEGFDDTLILVVNNKRATALTVPAVPEFALSSTELARVGDLDDIRVSFEGLQESNSLLGLGERFGGARYNKRNFLDLFDAVATGEDEGRESGSGESGYNSEAALILIDLDVPLAPGFGGCEHASSTAHVTESSLNFGDSSLLLGLV